MNERDPTPKIPMPVKAKPYKHQIEAFNFVCKCFGLIAEGGVSDANGRGDLPDLRQAFPEAGKPSP
jgi:hypothetical protein